MTEEKQSKTTAPIKVNWDDSKMATTYSNAVNASSTREEKSAERPEFLHTD